MSIDNVTSLDGALLLKGLADVLDLMPRLVDELEQQEREEVAHACRAAAEEVAKDCIPDRDFEAAYAYVGDEWRNALLRSLLGPEGASRALATR